MGYSLKAGCPSDASVGIAGAAAEAVLTSHIGDTQITVMSNFPHSSEVLPQVWLYESIMEVVDTSINLGRPWVLVLPHIT